MEEHKSQLADAKTSTNMLDSLPPKFAFWAGVVTATAIISLVGFVILLVVLFGNGGNASSKTAQANTNTAPTVVANTNTVNTQPTTVSGAVDMDALTNVRGEGKITLVEYSDTECPFCKKFHPTMQQMVEEYDGKVAWGYKHLPLTSLHPKAQREAEATECAAEQGKFWEYLDMVFDRTPSNNKLEDSELFAIADDLGLNRSQFDDCVESGKYTDKVKADAAEAQQLGGQGTPFSVIVDEDGKVLDVISGALPYESVQTALNQYVN